MRAFLLALFFALAPLPPTTLIVDAALVQKLPHCSLGSGYDADKDGLVDTGCPGADQFSTLVSGHYAIDVNSCDVSGTAVTYLDVNANTGNGVEIPASASQSGLFPHGQMRCLVTPAAGTYTVRVNLKSTGASKLWMATVPMLVTAPPGTSIQTDACNTASLCDASHRILNYGWATMAQTVVSAGSQIAFYFTWEDSLQINCIDITTNPSIPPVCPSGAAPPTPSYVALKAGGTPANCADLGAANVVDWSTGYNSGTTAPIVRMAWKAGTPVKGYICITASDSDIVAPTIANDDQTIFSGNDYLEWILTPTQTATDEASIDYAINAVPVWLDAKTTKGVYSTTPNYNMVCSKTGSWSVFCSFDLDYTVANDQLGLLQMVYRNVNNAGASNFYAIFGGTNPLGANDPTNWKVIKYSSTALPAPPPDSTPPIVGSVSFTNVGTNAMTASFTVADAESGVSTAFADYDSDSGGTYCNAAPGSGTCPAPCSISAGVATCSITGLAAGTSYFVRGRAINGVGLTANGAENNQATSSTTGDFYFNQATGKDANPCTIGAPCKTLAKLVSVVSPGKRAILQNGTWNVADGTDPGGHNVLRVQCGAGGNTVNGTPGNPITVQAQNPRMAVLNGDSLGDTLEVSGNCGFWVIDNLQFTAPDGTTPTLRTTGVEGNSIELHAGSNNFQITNNLIRGGNTYSGGGSLILIQGNNNLVQGNEVYLCHRNCIGTYGGNSGTTAHHNIFRGNYVGQAATSHCAPAINPNATCGPNDAYVEYTAGPGNIYEDNIAEQGPNTGNGAPALDADYYIKPTSVDVSHYGNISLGSVKTNGFLSSSNGNSIVKDMVIINSRIGMWIAGAKNIQISNLGVFDADPPVNDVVVDDDNTNNGVQLFPGPFTMDFVNSFANRASGNANGFYENNNAYGSVINASARWVKDYNGGGSTFAGSWTLLSNTTTTPQTGMGACKVYLPVGASGKGIGLNGDDIGPKLLYAYENGVRQDGTGGTIAKPLWDATQTGANYGKWRYAGAVIAGVNSSSTGSVASTVHQRLGFGGNGCLLPAGY